MSRKHRETDEQARARVALARDVAADLASDYVSKNPLVTEALLNAGMNIYSSGLDQSDELAADSAGTVIAARGGYDPLGLLLVLTTLDSIDVAEPRGALMFSTHPPTRDRIDRLAELADDSALARGGTLMDEARFSDAQARLFAQ
ncbi:MAG TPA: M48 family metalloprotease [Gammaproteobacteria bacterium]|jgi:predicted Zn-dependent protease|nr:M48 family metalloprotease [Gammaproteobacteria bacterium]